MLWGGSWRIIPKTPQIDFKWVGINCKRSEINFELLHCGARSGTSATGYGSSGQELAAAPKDLPPLGADVVSALGLELEAHP